MLRRIDKLAQLGTTLVTIRRNPAASAPGRHHPPHRACLDYTIAGIRREFRTQKPCEPNCTLEKLQQGTEPPLRSLGEMPDCE